MTPHWPETKLALAIEAEILGPLPPPPAHFPLLAPSSQCSSHPFILSLPPYPSGAHRVGPQPSAPASPGSSWQMCLFRLRPDLLAVGRSQESELWQALWVVLRPAHILGPLLLHFKTIPTFKALCSCSTYSLKCSFCRFSNDIKWSILILFKFQA